MLTEDEIVEIGARAFDRFALSQQGWSEAAINRAVTSLVQPSKHGLAHASCILAAFRAAGLVLEQDWQTMETAPKNPVGEIQGPEILVATKHHGHQFVVIMRYCAGYQNCWLDISSDSCVWANEKDGSMWRPLPAAPPTDKGGA